MNLSCFSHVRNWIFDLDNTLYPAHTDLFAQISVNIRRYVSELMNVPEDEAQEIQTKYYKKYGTTLRGLMVEHNIEPGAFLEFVHDIDHSVLKPDPTLANAIQKLPGRRFIMTNGTKKHAKNVAKALGITEHFEDMFGIVEADMIPKPHEETYNLFLTKNDISPTESCMFEDLPQNLTVPHALDMRTVLIIPKWTREVFREEWELDDKKNAHIDFVAEDLSLFLNNVITENFS